MTKKTEHHKLDTDTQVFFYEQEFYVLSNFSAFQVEVNTQIGRPKRFMTAEHAYHWKKFEDVGGWMGGVALGVQKAIEEASSAHQAFQIAQNMKGVRRQDWDTMKAGVMKDILLKKAYQHEYVMRKLMETGDRELVEDSWRDDYWGWGPNREGKNMLGQLWMAIRHEIKAAAHVNQVTPIG